MIASGPDVLLQLGTLGSILKKAVVKVLHDDFTNEGIKTTAEIAWKKNASDKWNDSNIKLILTNPHYVGDLVQGRTATESVTN